MAASWTQGNYQMVCPQQSIHSDHVSLEQRRFAGIIVTIPT